MHSLWPASLHIQSTSSRSLPPMRQHGVHLVQGIVCTCIKKAGFLQISAHRYIAAVFVPFLTARVTRKSNSRDRRLEQAEKALMFCLTRSKFPHELNLHAPRQSASRRPRSDLRWCGSPLLRSMCGLAQHGAVRFAVFCSGFPGTRVFAQRSMRAYIPTSYGVIICICAVCTLIRSIGPCAVEVATVSAWLTAISRRSRRDRRQLTTHFAALLQQN